MDQFCVIFKASQFPFKPGGADPTQHSGLVNSILVQVLLLTIAHYSPELLSHPRYLKQLSTFTLKLSHYKTLTKKKKVFENTYLRL